MLVQFSSVISKSWVSLLGSSAFVASHNPLKYVRREVVLVCILTRTRFSGVSLLLLPCPVVVSRVFIFRNSSDDVLSFRPAAGDIGFVKPMTLPLPLRDAMPHLHCLYILLRTPIAMLSKF